VLCKHVGGVWECMECGVCECVDVLCECVKLMYGCMEGFLECV